MLVIADGEGPSGIAGDDGRRPAPRSPTRRRRVVLEAANFERARHAARLARALGLRTDGSHRWERGVDPHLAPLGVARWAAQLLVELAGARHCRRRRWTSSRTLPERPRIVLRDAARSRRCVGHAIGRPTRRDGILARLGLRAGSAARRACASRRRRWRWLDVTREIDLVEEVARIHGLDRVPGDAARGAPRRRPRRRASAAAPRRGRAARAPACSEAITSRSWPARLRRSRSASAPTTRGGASSRSRTRSRPSTPCMRRRSCRACSRAVRRNARRRPRRTSRCSRSRTSTTPLDGEALPDEPWTLGAVARRPPRRRAAGAARPRGRTSSSPRACSRPSRAPARRCERGVRGRSAPFLHPGRAARVAGRRRATSACSASCTRPSPSASSWRAGRRLRARPRALAAARAGARRAVARPGRCRRSRQDIAVVVADEHAAGRRRRRPRARPARRCCADVEVFDVYRDAAALGDGTPLAGAAADLPGAATAR